MRVISGIAAAITSPSSHSVRATPRTSLVDLYLLRWRMQGEIFPVIGQTCQLVLLDIFESVGQRHVAVSMMMSIGFAVSSNMHELLTIALRIEAADQAPCEIFATEQ